MSLRLAFLACAAATLCACSGPDLTLSADRTTISAGGIDFATLTAQVFKSEDEPMGSGATVSFSTTSGSFGSATSDTTTDDVSTNGQGQATIKLYSAKDPGSATVSASYYDDASGITAESSITITFSTASGKNTPVDGTFRMTCDAANIGALRVPMPDIKVTCRLSAQDSQGTTLPANALSPTFLTEAGSLTPEDDYSTGKRVYIYSPAGGSSSPRDVAREQSLAEPYYLDKNGKERNPRDGLATLVAVVDGEEAYTDSNGNGKYDQGEPFVDAAEPFVDMDDDDTWDADEKYQDSDGNGKWDKANAQWDKKTKIMAVYKILWTGAVDSSTKTSRIDTSSGSTAIADGGQLDLTAYLLDANLNPVAAFDKNSDYLEWTLNAGSSDATSNDNTQVTLKNVLGFSFNTQAVTERKRWQIVSNSFSAPTYKFTVSDYYPKDGTSNPLAFSVSVTAYLTPGPTTDGTYLSQVTDALKDKLSGTCD